MENHKPDAFLFIGGGASQLGSLRDLVNRGFKIVVTDKNVDSPCREAATEFFQISATNLDGLTRLVDKLSDRYNFCGTYGVADYAAEAVFLLSKKMKLKEGLGAEVKAFTDKVTTSRLLSDNGLSVPKLLYHTDSGQIPSQQLLLEWRGRCLVIKIRHGNNSRGVHICKDASPERVVCIIGRVLSLSNSYMVEEFVEGEIGNVDGLVVGGEFIPISTTVRLNDPDIPHVCRALIQPASCWPGYEEQAFELIRQSALTLGYRNGPITADLLIGSEKKITIMEISPHFHCLFNDTQRGNGNPLAAYFAYLSGDTHWRRHLEGLGAKHGLSFHGFVPSDGYVLEIAGIDEARMLPGVTSILTSIAAGSRVFFNEEEKSLAYLAWANAPTRKALMRLLEEIQKTVRIEVSENKV